MICSTQVVLKIYYFPVSLTWKDWPVVAYRNKTDFYVVFIRSY